MDSAQYEWMLSELLDVYQNYPNEDEIMMQYLLPSLCKALAVLKMASEKLSYCFLCCFHRGKRSQQDSSLKMMNNGELICNILRTRRTCMRTKYTIFYFNCISATLLPNFFCHCWCIVGEKHKGGRPRVYVDCMFISRDTDYQNHFLGRSYFRKSCENH